LIYIVEYLILRAREWLKFFLKANFLNLYRSW